MKDKINNLRNEFTSLSITSAEELESVRIDYLGKKGKITSLLSELKSVPKEEIKEAGKEINLFKNEVMNKLEELKEYFEKEKLNEKLKSESIDVTLSETVMELGSENPIEKIVEKLEDTFISLGYDVVEGPEIEEDLYNFELLNLPIGHPARDEQDTFYITPSLLLRSQTSPVQVREMIKNEEKSPLRIVCPGKTYRRDNDDASHSHQFTQMEGLLIDKDISLADLKGTMETVVRTLFKDVETRFRPSFYPFTEPSVELDISCFRCGGKGCDLCKHSGYITVGGAGMVHPNVLRNGGYDPEKYRGYAFGLGIDRLTLLKYNINDIRLLYNNDIRGIKNFKRRDEE